MTNSELANAALFVMLYLAPLAVVVAIVSFVLAVTRAATAAACG